MATIAELLALPHAWAATIGAVLAALLVVVGALDGAGVVRARRWLDRGVLALVAAMLVSTLLGPAIVVGLHPPADPLHFLYAAVALVGTPALRLVAMRRRSARVGWWVAAGGLLTLGTLLRLWATGG